MHAQLTTRFSTDDCIIIYNYDASVTVQQRYCMTIDTKDESCIDLSIIVIIRKHDDWVRGVTENVM